MKKKTATHIGQLSPHEPRKLAVVTGASSGIGLALAKQFAGNGYDLIVVAQHDGIDAAAEALRGSGVSVQPYQLDLASEEGVEKLFARIHETGRALDAIAINAGIGVGGAGFEATDWEKERKMILLNVLSTAYTAKLAVRKMLEQGGGKILFTASISSLMPGAFESVYNASKAFVYSLSESLHLEYKDRGITVTALLPGPTDTNFFHRAGMDDTLVGAKLKHDNQPEDVAREGFEALMAGKSHVVAASLKTKIQAQVSKVLPSQLATAAHTKMSEPGSAPKH